MIEYHTGTEGWTSTAERNAPLYKEVLAFSMEGRYVLATYLGHDCYSISSLGYPVLGQCRVTFWRPMPLSPVDEA